MPNKLLGQHFLRNPDVVKKIIAAIDTQKKETIIEVGPGYGELTWPLAEACVAQGAHLIAIEKDQKLADELRIMNREPGIEIIAGDVLKILTSRLTSFNPAYKIIGNIPYYLTGHLLRIVSELENHPSRCVFMVQKEVAMRMVAEVGGMNRLAASVRFWADVKILTVVSKMDFSPSPKVDSAVIVLDKKQKPALADAEKYFTAVRAIFAQPRKTILNNLASKKEELNKEQIVERLQDANIDPNSRPQGLSVEKIAQIAEIFF